MAKEYVPIFFDWLDVTQDLSQEEKGNLIDAVVSYASGREYEHLLAGAERIAFRFMKGQVDRNDAISEARSKARASAGGNKQQQNDIGANKTEQNVTNDNKPQQNETKIPKEKDNKKQEQEQKKKEELEVAERFTTFWSAYPRHVNKQAALKEFTKLKPDEDLLNTMLWAVEQQKKSDQWVKDGGQFIPHPATWLHGRRWEDEIRQSTTGKPADARDVHGYSQRDYSNAQNDAIKRMMDDTWGDEMAVTG